MIKGMAVALNQEEADHYDKTGELPDDVAALIRDNVKAPVASGLDIVSDPKPEPEAVADETVEQLPPLAVGAQAQAWADRPVRRKSGPEQLGDDARALMGNPALATAGLGTPGLNPQHSIGFTVWVETYGKRELDREVIQRAMKLLYLGFGKDNLRVTINGTTFDIGDEGVLIGPKGMME
jgi:hypothetical protein